MSAGFDVRDQECEPVGVRGQVPARVLVPTPPLQLPLPLIKGATLLLVKVSWNSKLTVVTCRLELDVQP